MPFDPTQLKSDDRTVRAILICILLLAGCVRFYGIGWGTNPETGKFHVFHPDEAQIIRNSQHIGVDLYKILSPYGKAPMIVYAAIVRTAGWVGGFDPYDFKDNEVTRRSYIIGRAISAILGVLTVWIVFQIGCHMGGVWTGLLSALLLAFCTGHIQQSHYYTVDVSLGFWVSLSVYLMLRMPSPNIWVYVFCAIATGMAASTRFVGAAVGIAFGIAHLWQSKTIDRWIPDWRSLLKPAIGVFLFVFIAVVVACEPFLLFDRDHLFKEGDIRTLLTGIDVAQGEVVRIWTLYDFSTTPYLFYFTNLLRHAMGTPLEAAALLGLLIAAIRRKRVAWMLLGWLVPYFASVGGLHTKPIRYVTPLLPFLTVFAGWFVVWAACQIRRKWDHMLVYALPAVVVVAPTIAYAAAWTRIYQEEDSRFTAQRWIQSNISEKSLVLAERGGFPTGWMVPKPKYKQRIFGAAYFIALNGHAPFASMIEYVGVKLKDVEWVVIVEENRSRQYREVPVRFPVGHSFYADLISETLGFRLVESCKVTPAIFGWEVDESDSDPTFTAFDHPKVMIFRRVSDSKERLELLKKRLHADTGLPDRYIESGYKAYKAGHYSVAEAQFQKARSLKEKFPLVHLLLREVYLRQGRVRSARRSLNAARGKTGGLNPESSIGLVKVGMRAEGLALLEPVLADKRYRKVKGLDLNRIRNIVVLARIDLGKEAYRNGDSETAIQQFLRAEEHNPNQYRPKFYQGVVHYRDGNFELAIDSFRKALQVSPTWRARLGLAQALRKGGLQDRAIPHYEEVKRLLPDNPRVREAVDNLLQTGKSFEITFDLD